MHNQKLHLALRTYRYRFGWKSDPAKSVYLLSHRMCPSLGQCPHGNWYLWCYPLLLEYGHQGYKPLGYKPLGYKPLGYDPLGYDPLGCDPVGWRDLLNESQGIGDLDSSGQKYDPLRDIPETDRSRIWE